MSEKDDVTFFGYHVVCLIDVLGQKQKLAHWREVSVDGQVTPDFIEALKGTVGTVLGFRDLFTQFFDDFDQCTTPDKLAALPKEQQERYWRIKKARVWVERFSDTFVFSSPVPNTFGDATVTPMLQVLGACCMAMLASLAAEVPVRGAITLGLGGKLEDRSFYGPALAEAYHLENEVADYPRVVVSPTVQDFLSEGSIYTQDGVLAPIMAWQAMTCRSLITCDADGFWIVDFLGNGAHALIGSKPGFVRYIEASYQFVCTESQRFGNERNAKLADRYHLLQQYIESRLPIWGIEAKRNEA